MLPHEDLPSAAAARLAAALPDLRPDILMNYPSPETVQPKLQLRQMGG